MLNDLLLEYLNISRYAESTSLRLKNISEGNIHPTDIETIRSLIDRLDDDNDTTHWLLNPKTREILNKYIPDYSVLKYYLRCVLDSSEDKAVFLSKVFDELHLDAEEQAAIANDYGE